MCIRDSTEGEKLDTLEQSEIYKHTKAHKNNIQTKRHNSNHTYYSNTHTTSIFNYNSNYYYSNKNSAKLKVWRNFLSFFTMSHFRKVFTIKPCITNLR